MATFSSLAFELGQRRRPRWARRCWSRSSRAGSRAGRRFRPAAAPGAGWRRGAVPAGQRVGGAAVHADSRAAAAPSPSSPLPRSTSVAWALARAKNSSAQEQLLGRQQRALRVVLQKAVALARVGPEALQRLVQLAVQHQRGILAQVVEDGGRLFEEQRQVVLDAGGGHAGAHVLVDAAGRVAFDLLAPARAEGARAASSIGNSRPGSSRTSGTGYRLRWLSGSKVRMRIDLVAEQVHPVGHQEPIGNRSIRPPRTAYSPGLPPGSRAVAGQRELRLERGFVQPLFCLEVEGVAGQEAGGASRVSAVVAGSSTTSSSPLRMRHSVARRSEIRSWCGEKLS
jgi:hypothetical protein